LAYRWIISVASLLLSGAALALPLQEALTLAREQATTLQALDAKTRRAEALHQQTSRAFLPSVSADASWLRADSSLITGIPLPDPGSPTGIRRTDLGPVEGSLAGLQVIQQIYNADALLQREAANLNLRARRQARRWGEQALRLEVARRYFNIGRLEKRRAAARQSRTATQATARQARNGYEQGLASRLDVEQVNAERASAHARLVNARAARQQAVYELKSLLGLPQDHSLESTEPMPAPTPPRTFPKSSQSMDGVEDLNGGEEWERPDLQARRLAAEAASTKIEAARAEWIPRVNLLARQQWANGEQPLDETADGWMIAINLQWTLFDGLGRQGRIAQSRAEADQARTELEATHRRIEKEQAIALNRWQAGYAAWLAASKATQAAERAARLATRRYEEGLGSMTDLLAARARLDSARANRIDSRYQAILASMNYHLQHGRDPLLSLGEALQ